VTRFESFMMALSLAALVEVLQSLNTM